MSVLSSHQLGFEFTAVPASSVRVFTGHYWSIGKTYTGPNGQQPNHLAAGNFINIIEKGHESAEFRLYTNKAAFDADPASPVAIIQMVMRAGVLAGRSKPMDFGLRVCNGWDQFNNERLVVEEFDVVLAGETVTDSGTAGGGSTDPGGGGAPK